MMKRVILLYLMKLAMPLALSAEEADSLQADTMQRDWFVSPIPTLPLSSFEDMRKMLEKDAASMSLSDYSEAENIEMAEPSFAWVNITGLTSLPLSKTDVKEVWVEVLDGHGGYFRKRALLKAQGSWSLKFPKRNFSCQFCENDWTATTTPGIRIGDWVQQDAFHFKAFYTDFCRGIGEIGYKLFRCIVTDRSPYWVRGGYTVSSKRARCFPDGFPCAVYVDGAFQGLYAWQLKKSRKNMNMEKTNELHIHIDGYLGNSTLFHGNVQWNSFDIRHPKAPYVTGKTKDAIIQLSQYHAELTALEESGADSLAMKRAFEQRFDISSLLDYNVFHQFVCNCDGSLKNWQWFTYDGRKWLVAPYDLDQIFGLNLYGVIRPAVWQHAQLTEGPFWWVAHYYQKELRERYAELRRNGALSAANILSIIDDWYNRVTEAMYEQEKIRWPDSPCYGPAICGHGWQPCPDWTRYQTTPDYSATTKYQAGDVCKLEGRLWEATLPSQGVRPCQRNSQLDSLQRLECWVTERLTYLDEQYSLRDFSQQISPTFQPNADAIYYNLQGQPVNRPRKGIYIRNGRKVYVK